MFLLVHINIRKMVCIPCYITQSRANLEHRLILVFRVGYFDVDYLLADTQEGLFTR